MNSIDLNEKKYIDYYFIILFSVLPISIIIGPSISLLNILIIDFSFIVYLFIKKDFSFLTNSTFKILIFFYIYLIFNSLVSLEPSYGIYRNLGFIRVIILFICINYFFLKKEFFDKVFLFWFLILLIVVFDIFYEAYFGKNILNFASRGSGGGRIVSFFKDELIVGGYLGGFFLLVIGFFLEKKKLSKKHLNVLISFLFLFAIILTGERSNSIKAFLSVILLLFFLENFEFKKKIIFISLILISVSTVIASSEFLSLRFVKQIKPAMSPTNNNYFYLYRSGYFVFKEHPLFGVGNKNYRFVTCDQPSEDEKKKNVNLFCSTHPHQIYFEFLSEHGLIGFMILIYLFYKLIFSKYKTVIKGQNFISLGSFLFLIMTFLPIIPSGAFFGDFTLTIFALNLSIMYGSNPRLNIFNNN